ncbi:hypothetical protein [Sphingobium sp. KCTC 72723]|uniref:hypothetical protein n=1 Tax=Sphingobium sp. KCTC 72723 TaxID=2733867 RepID=UPI001CB7424B|nr:hypothetical protein [Sphingobium sp. KCTC 72723]
MLGAIEHMKRFDDQPAAWSFGTWKNLKTANNHEEYWLSSTAIALEYHGKDLAAKGAALHAALDRLGYAHVIFDSMTRKGEATVSVMIPLTEAVNKGQYARLAKVLMSEINEYRAADGNCAMTHLCHVHSESEIVAHEGAILAPMAKIKETKDLYQGQDPNAFCGAGKRAIPHITPPTFTSHDDLFVWTKTDVEIARDDADAILAKIGLKLN